MNEKKNFYLDIELLNEVDNKANISKTITCALKYASENEDDFICFVKECSAQHLLTEHAPVLHKIVSGGQLVHNVYVDCGGVKSFFGIGHKAFVSDGLLIIDSPTASIALEVRAKITYAHRPNDINSDQSCVDVSFREEECLE